MAEPDSVKTFEDLILRVARETGIAYYGAAGSSQAMIPVDYPDLQRCKEIVNDAFLEFMADAPVSGWRWRRRKLSLSITGTRTTGTADSASSTTIVDSDLSDIYDTDDEIVGYYCYITGGTGEGSWAIITGYTALTGTVTVVDWLSEYGLADGTDPDTDSTFAITPVETVGGDIARYPLPENFYGEIVGPIRYASDTSHSAFIEWADESFIRARRAVSVRSGHPAYAAIRALEPIDENIGYAPKRRKELILDPKPSQSDIIEFPYLLLFNKMDLESGIADSGSDTTLVDGERTEGNEYFTGWKISIIDGTGLGSNAIVTSYTGASGTFNVADWLTVAGAAGGTNPDADSVYKVEPIHNLHPAGANFDVVIESACMAKAEMKIEEIAAGYIDKYLKKDLPKAYEIDARMAPRKLRSMNYRVNRERVWKDVTYT